MKKWDDVIIVAFVVLLSLAAIWGVATKEPAPTAGVDPLSSRSTFDGN